MAQLEPALQFLLPHEGGWSNRRNDRGGPTMHGITLAVAQRYGIMTEDALRAISSADVERIYRAEFWRFDGIQSQAVASKIMDLCVNFGGGTEVRMVQEILGVQPDGVYGPATEAAVNAQDPDSLISEICAASVARYNEIEAAHPEDEEFLAGWLVRAKAVPDAA